MNVLLIMNFFFKKIFKKITKKENKDLVLSTFQTFVSHFKTKGLYTPSAILEG